MASKAAQPVQKVKQASKQATQRVTKQATRKVQQGTGSVKDLLNEDTGSTLGAAGLLGFALLIAGGLVLGSEFSTPSGLQQALCFLTVEWHDMVQDTVFFLLRILLDCSKNLTNRWVTYSGSH